VPLVTSHLPQNFIKAPGISIPKKSSFKEFAEAPDRNFKEEKMQKLPIACKF
jgi:hypothetical protein